MAFIGHDIVDLTDAGRLFRPYHNFMAKKILSRCKAFLNV